MPDLTNLHAALKLCGHRWDLEILTSLQRRPMRFTDLQAIDPRPSGKSLNEALRRLQDWDLVCRSHGGGASLYNLTSAGRHLLPLLTNFTSELQRWVDQYAVDTERTAQPR